MPVRFRCRYCNQLLGIARRKIGQEVNCPTCHHAVLVPPHDSPDVDQPAPARKDPLFEGSDLDALLQPAVVSPPEPPRPAPPPLSPAPPPPPLMFDADPFKPPPPLPPAAAPPAALTLSPMQATLLTVGAVLVLAVAFAAGLLIGRFCL